MVIYEKTRTKKKVKERRGKKRIQTSVLTDIINVYYNEQGQTSKQAKIKLHSTKH